MHTRNLLLIALTVFQASFHTESGSSEENRNTKNPVRLPHPSKSENHAEESNSSSKRSAKKKSAKQKKQASNTLDEDQLEELGFVDILKTES